MSQNLWTGSECDDMQGPDTSGLCGGYSVSRRCAPALETAASLAQHPVVVEFSSDNEHAAGWQSRSRAPGRLLFALVLTLALIGIPDLTHERLASIALLALPLVFVLTMLGIWVETSLRRRPFWPAALEILQLSCVGYLLAIALLLPLVLQARGLPL